MSGHTALLFELFWRFAVISLFAVGGGVAMMLPLMDQWFVQQLHWLDQRSFTELLAVSQAAPGPNFLIVPLIAWRVAALPGLIVVMLAFLIPPGTISLVVGRWLHRRDTPAVAVFRRAVRPVTGGLMIATGAIVALTVDRGLVPAAITVGAAALSLIVDIPPLWYCLGAGILGALLA